MEALERLFPPLKGKRRKKLQPQRVLTLISKYRENHRLPRKNLSLSWAIHLFLSNHHWWWLLCPRAGTGPSDCASHAGRLQGSGLRSHVTSQLFRSFSLGSQSFKTIFLLFSVRTICRPFVDFPLSRFQMQNWKAWCLRHHHCRFHDLSGSFGRQWLPTEKEQEKKTTLLC